jgi:hypothetical protein
MKTSDRAFRKSDGYSARPGFIITYQTEWKRPTGFSSPTNHPQGRAILENSERSPTNPDDDSKL